MKYLAFYALICVIACSSSSSTKENKPQETSASTFGISGDEDIIGEWKLTMTILDNNRNEKIEEDERANAMTQLNDFLKLNIDGTAVFSPLKIKGRYELKPNSDGTRRSLNLYDKNNFKTPYGRIISVSNTDLILYKNSIGSVFFIWKRP